MNCLIGYTGFIGSVLTRHISNCDLYNSTNISAIVGKTYDVVYCCGIQSKKWWANKNTTLDWEGIENLINCVKQITCNKFILISTIAIYDNEPYGKHRLKAEKMLNEIMGEKLHIIRLPSLFGSGLRKNILYDLTKKNQREPINTLDLIQWYNVDYIYSDIQNMINKNIKLLEVYPKPITNEILINLFNYEVDSVTDKDTCIIQNIKPSNGYYCNENKVINDLIKYINGCM